MIPYPAQVSRVYPQSPSFADKLLSIAQAGFRFAAESRFHQTSPKELEKRLAICQPCEHWVAKAFKNTGGCSLCGCSTWAKLRMPLEQCPINKWGIEEQNEEKPTE
jgi:hypothetical protein